MDDKKVVEHIVKWLRDYAIDAKLSGFVLGISGGIDSALTSVLCAKTGLPTLCVTLPIHQDDSQVNRANLQIEYLKSRYDNVNSLDVNLTDIFDNFKNLLSDSATSSKLDLALANTRSRLRMTTLYYFAGLENLLVVGTGNKVEDFGIGFFTKYGDGGVDISPIADLNKSEVYSLSSYLCVPELIQKAPPTDGLFGDNRTDQDQIGASYDELEWAMEVDKTGISESSFSDRQKKVYSIYKNLSNLNSHKMKPIPVCKIPTILKDNQN